MFGGVLRENGTGDGKPAKGLREEPNEGHDGLRDSEKRPCEENGWIVKVEEEVRGAVVEHEE